MGSRGPVPKRIDQRLGNVTKAEIAGVERAPAAPEVVVPEPDEGWHEIARSWFVSLGESGQSRFFEPSDWQTARYVAEAMSTNLQQGRFSAQLFAAVMAATSNLLATEGDRRRLRLELDRATEDAPAAPVFDIASYQSSLA